MPEHMTAGQLERPEGGDHVADAGQTDSSPTIPAPTRLLTIGIAITSLALGVVLFFAPAWSSHRFAWKLSPFVTMTIGAWCLGNAWMAFWALTHPRWRESIAILAYLWIFGLSEGSVALAFRHLVPVGHALTVPYLVVIGMMVLAAVVGVVDVLRTRAVTSASQGDRTPKWIQRMIAGFVAFVVFLSAVAFLHPATGASLRVFPEVLTSFTVRAFGAFYISLALGALVTAVLGRLDVALNIGMGGLGLVAIITVATFVYIGVFDISDHPLQVLYIAAYVAVMVLAAAVLYRYRARLRLRERL